MKTTRLLISICLVLFLCAELHASLVGDTISGYATYPTNPIGNRFEEDTAVVSNAVIEFHINSFYLPITVDFTDYTLNVHFFNTPGYGTNQHVNWTFTFSDLDYAFPIADLTVLQDTFDTSPTVSWTLLR